MLEKALLIGIPAINILTLFVISIFGASIFGSGELLPYGVFLLSLATFLSVAVGRHAEKKAIYITYVFLSAGLFIIAYAQIYAKFHVGSPPGGNLDEFSERVYFSIVTFTTLGYGDYRLFPETQVIAALQAIGGYLYMGMLIGLVLELNER